MRKIIRLEISRCLHSEPADFEDGRNSLGAARGTNTCAGPGVERRARSRGRIALERWEALAANCISSQFRTSQAPGQETKSGETCESTAKESARCVIEGGQWACRVISVTKMQRFGDPRQVQTFDLIEDDQGMLQTTYLDEDTNTRFYMDWDIMKWKVFQNKGLMLFDL